jgi:urease accessory protein
MSALLKDPPATSPEEDSLATSVQGWHAHLRLGFRRGPGRTVLAERERKGPLSVQRAFYPEGDHCHLYLLHPPGGVAGGDRLEIEARVSEAAGALVTTPGATKFYRSVGPEASQQQHLRVDGGALEWLPQENILFPAAKVQLSTTVELEGDARFIGWEINCLGRPVNGERFEPGRAGFRFRLLKDGLPLFIERQVVKGGASLIGAANLRGNPVFGSLYAYPADGGLLERVRQALDEPEEVGLTLLDGLLVARYLGDSTEQCRKFFAEIWALSRPEVIGRKPCTPRIWNT